MNTVSILAERYHDFSYGHRVVGHEGKCCMLHGHNGRATFACQAMDGLDTVGRVVDFSVLKSTLCQWLEDNWDHRMLIWDKDPMLTMLNQVSPESIVVVPFNPTAENMASFLLTVVGPQLLKALGVELTQVKMQETRKCSALVIKAPEPHAPPAIKNDLFGDV